MNNSTEQGLECLIWKTPATVKWHLDAEAYIERYLVNSVRANGEYKTDSDVANVLDECDDRTKARLTTWLLDQRKQGTAVPTITEETVANAEQSLDLPMGERADRLLKTIEEEIQYNGQLFHISEDWIPVSESINIDEVRFLASYLESQGWLSADRERATAKHGAAYQLTVEGHIHLSKLKRANPGSTRAFVAMWFGEPDGERASMDNAYQSMELAIREAGYDPVRIDKLNHLNKIDDEIVAEIRRSRFVVADFTQGESGARGGVYFEAGFAKGLNIEVIFTCRKGSIEKVHFDTRQYRHIVWETPEELRTELLNSIRANIGQGPLKSQQ